MTAPYGIAVATLVYQRARREGRIVRLGPRPAELVGRELLLKMIRDRFTPDPSEPAVQVLSGLGGVGKTSVAVEYAYARAHAYDLVWQFNAEEPAALAGQVRELAGLLGVVDVFERGDALALLHAELAARDKPWLLVLDNIADPADVSRLLPKAGSGHVLVTTQRTDWPAAIRLDVPVLERDVAVEYLLSHAHDADAGVAGDLADALGLLPLALAQAAAFLLNTGRSMADYLELFSSERARLLARPVHGGYGKPLAGAWSAAVTQLAQSNPPALTLLRLLSCFAPDAIPIRQLLPQGVDALTDQADPIAGQVRVLTADGFALDDALIALRDFSLISPPLPDAVSIHRLVQAVTLDSMTSQERECWRAVAARLLEAALPDDPQLPANWPVYAALLAHARSVSEPWSTGLLDFVRFLGASGNDRAALEVVGQLVAACERHYGPEHPESLTTRGRLAEAIGTAGDPAGARDLLAGLLPICERVEGPENPRTLTIRNDLARWTGHAGDAALARDQFAALLPIWRRVAGPLHPDTFDACHGLAWWTGEAGDPAKARDLYAELLPTRTRVLGPDHPSVLDTQENVARWTGEAGNPAAARDQFAALLPLREHMQGPEHPKTLTTRNHLAWWTAAAGDAVEGREIFMAVIPVRERVLGAEHPDTLDTRHGLAWLVGVAGDPATARDMLVALLPVRDRVMGPDHPQSLDARHDFALWTGAAGDATTARDLSAALLPHRERLHGPEHPRTLNTRASLARWTGEAGNPAEARDLLAALLPVVERVMGARHPQTLAVREDLGHWTRQAKS